MDGGLDIKEEMLHQLATCPEKKMDLVGTFLDFVYFLGVNSNIY